MAGNEPRRGRGASATVLPVAPTVCGHFPFGQPNTVRPMRRPVRPARALIVGIYPSAFHVAWSPPGTTSRRPLIGSLAVDVEPTVFWNGAEPSPEVLLDQWKTEVGFNESRHGTVSVEHNGPSSLGLERNVLIPLRLADDEVAFTNVVPWFFVKSGRGSKGEAIKQRFEPFGIENGVDPGSLPPRPTPHQLVEIARSDNRRDSLRAEILEADAPVVVTLGQEALDSVRAVTDRCAGVQSRLAPAGYGTRGEVVIGSTTFELLPLAHPGFVRQTTRADWKDALAQWTEADQSDG